MAHRPWTPLVLGAQDLGAVLRDDLPVLVSFEAENCSPCVALSPRLDEIALEFAARVLVVRVMGADDPSTAARHHLVFLPTLTFWQGGQERLRLDGAVSTEALRAHLRFVLGVGPMPEHALGPRFVVQGAFRPTVHR